MNGLFLYFTIGFISMGPAIISWDYFTEKFPVKVGRVEGNADMEVVNQFLERDIRDSGQGA